MKPIVATYYLEGKDGRIFSKFEATDVDRCLDGNCYIATTWTDYSMRDVLEWDFFADVYCKFDGCTHWYFNGEDYDPESDKRTHDNEINAYYHICGPERFNEHIMNMCFVWKLAEMVLKKSYDDSRYSECIDDHYDVNDFTGKLVNKMLEGYTITVKLDI